MTSASGGRPGHAGVLVVGAGPSGSALAGDLGRRGVDVLLLEQTDAIVHDARLHAVSVRTMELARHWGIEDDLRHCGWPLDHPQDVVWGTSLSEPEIARIHWPPISRMEPPPTSPTFAQRCPQKWFNAILLSFAQRQDTVTVLLRWQVTDVVPDDDHVTVRAKNLETGEERIITTSYLVACDGARSNIRRSLGIDTIKSSVWGTSAEVIIRSPQLKAIPLAQTLGRFTVLEPTGMSISLLPFDGLDQYRVTLMVGDGTETDKQTMLDAVHKIAGTEVDVEFMTDILPWSNRETLATTMRHGRVFLAGDAAHTMPTTGGLGMNTGVQDSLDLGWKLDAVLQGWGGQYLLDSYDPERRTAVRQIAALASSIYQDWVRTRQEHPAFWADIAAGGSAAEHATQKLGESLIRTFRREFNNIAASLGYRYEGSPICVPDGTPDPTPATFDQYIPTARPGHRAPHAWLSSGESTLDSFGPGFTLLVIGRDGSAAGAMTTAARALSMPLQICAVTDFIVAAAIGELYECTFALVRPDGHVAWRDSRLPADPRQVLDIVRGAVRPGTRTTTSSSAAAVNG
jgi:2-polyprenyl-6-methoxyphenol hydroxylase-like FAD-dependent oxidoreductase